MVQKMTNKTKAMLPENILALFYFIDYLEKNKKEYQEIDQRKKSGQTLGC